MAQWQDEGIILSAKRYGERNAVVSVITSVHGHCKGFYQFSKRGEASLQPGTQVQAHWNARLSEHLGRWQFETMAVNAATFMNQPAVLAALTSACAWLEMTLPEREPHPALYHHFKLLLTDLHHPWRWQQTYLLFEIALLKELGFGLDLSKCAVTGETADLYYISPRTGRAVTQAIGTPYHEKLFIIPEFLKDPDSLKPLSWAELQQGFALTTYFLEQFLLPHYPCSLPEARQRLYSYLADAIPAA